MKNILITGGLGFLGSYCIERYSKDGCNIKVIDNLSTNVVGPDYFKDIDLDIKNVLDHEWDKNEKYDLIVHLASPVGPVGILKHSGKMAQYIVDDVYWAIKGALMNDCPLIFISTSEVYGFRDKAERLKEEDKKLLVGDYKVRNEYSTAKLLCEIILDNTAKVSNLKYQILRPFNISGARQLRDGGFVLPTFVQQALNNEDITVFGDGNQVRAFTHVKDIVEGIYLVSKTEKMNQIWNVGIPNNVSTIGYMAERVAEFTKTKSKIVNIDPKTIHGDLYEEAWDKIPESTKIQEELGWKSTYTIDDIVKEVISYYENN